MTDTNGTGDTGPIGVTPNDVTFADLGFAPPLLSAIAESGYTKPTPIQWKAIPQVLAGRDVLGIAQTGTGKTASFVLPMIERLAQGRARARMPRTLILEPTRELADQVAENFRKYGKNHKLTMALLIGGVSFGDQDVLLTKGVDVLIATPGRLLDHFERGKLLLTGVNMLVIDEADRMLDMGFIPDIERIVKLTPFTRQTLFFSATMPPEIKRLTEQFLQAPVKVEVARQSQAAATITQRLLKSPSSDPKTKRIVLRAAIQSALPTMKNSIVFCNRKTDVDIVAKSLKVYGFDAAPIHGDLQQSQRMATLERFRNNELQILVASDVAARGLDIPAVSHVFNFDVPRHAEDYVHRIGRTGRAGRSGEAFMIVTPGDTKALDGVQNLIKSKIDFAELDGLPDENMQEPSPTKAKPSRAKKTRNHKQAAPAELDPAPTLNDTPFESTQKERAKNRRNLRRTNPESRVQSHLTDPLAIIDLGEEINPDRSLELLGVSRHTSLGSNHRLYAQPNSDTNRELRPNRGGRTRYRREDDEQNVLAFGEDVPAFMSIAIPHLAKPD
ncbi:DEAD/DEAH box helicase [Candidatus Phycosocius spiralis]|uniref:DEAD/DEAH box helicase n=1 Tax=Candidatus Phycosocius spiralis TaxID=2815099 RepID=A0ABQ4PWK1_9PROT|nr:DEAD/DEAH box helicase [Candidatus Phycosocius spiralis]GIU67339.1 DEAD/DEAH box helicase [Candidatus Phycosocius spiralis]